MESVMCGCVRVCVWGGGVVFFTSPIGTLGTSGSNLVKYSGESRGGLGGSHLPVGIHFFLFFYSTSTQPSTQTPIHNPPLSVNHRPAPVGAELDPPLKYVTREKRLGKMYPHRDYNISVGEKGQNVYTTIGVVMFTARERMVL